MKIKLIKIVKDFEGKVFSEINLREPTGSDLMDCGFPWKYQTDDEGVTSRVPDPRSIGKLISVLGDIPITAVHQMHVSDFLKANGVVTGFFQILEEPPSKSSEDISS